MNDKISSNSNIPAQDLEQRGCFQRETHFPHVWHSKFWCNGLGLDESNRLRGPVPDHNHTEVLTAEGSKIKGFEQPTIGYSAPELNMLGDADIEVETTEAPLDETDALLASRLAVYGDRINNMERVAKIWSGLLGVEIHDWQVPLLMGAYKMFRTFQTPDYSDNSDDIFGWGKMFQEVMEANHGGIVKARTVEEYEAAVQVRDATTSDQIQFYKDHMDLSKYKWVGSDNPAFKQAEKQSNYGAQDGPCEDPECKAC
jgi:hypothetical protein